MCKSITCPHCGRPGWAGCGLHVEQVLGNVPDDQRCHCDAPTTSVFGKRTWTFSRQRR